MPKPSAVSAAATHGVATMPAPEAINRQNSRWTPREGRGRPGERIGGEMTAGTNSDGKWEVHVSIPLVVSGDVS